MLLNMQRRLLHERLEKVARFRNNSELSDTVIDIMVGLKYPDIPEEVCEWMDVMYSRFEEGQPYFLYGTVNGNIFHGVGLYSNGFWRSSEEDAPYEDYGIEVSHFMEMTCP